MLALAGLLCLATTALAQNAKDPKAGNAPAKACGGTDILLDLSTKEPDLLARIIREAETIENGNAVLWKIERQGTPPSHLLGTIHLTDERITTLSPKVADILKTAKQVLLEADDVSPEASANALLEASKTAVYTDGQSLDKQLTPDEFKTARAALDRAGMPPAVAHVFRPWLVTMLLSASDCERAKIQRGLPILDMKIAAEAKARGIPVIGLETISEQLAAMASLPDDQQVGMLRATLAYADRIDDVTETLVRLYTERRTGAVWPLQLALASKAGIGEDAFKAFHEKILLARNLTMRDRALVHFEKGDTFMAVGALHLSGKGGLVELLREKGFTVTAVD